MLYLQLGGFPYSSFCFLHSPYWASPPISNQKANECHWRWTSRGHWGLQHCCWPLSECRWHAWHLTCNLRPNSTVHVLRHKSHFRISALGTGWHVSFTWLVTITLYNRRHFWRCSPFVSDNVVFTNNLCTERGIWWTSLRVQTKNSKLVLGLLSLTVTEPPSHLPHSERLHKAQC